MIKFFRKIRYNLMEQNKTGKYLKYAVGEIILVVIGILIALQVNNWNERRKLQNESQEVLKGLNIEFKNNREVLKERIDYIEDANKYVQAVLSLTNKDESQLRAVNIDSIISLSLKYGNYNPANSTIQELISSGKLNIIENDQLKNNLFNWLQILEDTDEDFKNQDLQAITMLEVYLSKNISFKNTVTYHPLDFGDGESKLFDKKYVHIFNDLEFENLYYGKRFWNTVMINHYKELDHLAQEIINQTENIK
ncbi:hypothetical protein MWU50_06255 [Flavobacteriaceae bacterium S0862]|nr:hypothetical protein [Flavobacteriaceae bacterium S0862]